MLTPYGGEMRDEPSYTELLLMYWSFGTVVSMERKEHSRNLLDNLASLKARRLGRREGIEQHRGC
jgi:hypothetical protein